MDFFDTLAATHGDRSALEKKQQKELFYAEMKKRGFDFDDIVDTPITSSSGRLPKSLIPVIENSAEEFHMFNAALADIHKKGIVNIVDALVFIGQDWLAENDIIKLLDELNFIKVKNEFISKYPALLDPKPETEFSLLDFLDEDND